MGLGFIAGVQLRGTPSRLQVDSPRFMRGQACIGRARPSLAPGWGANEWFTSQAPGPDLVCCSGRRKHGHLGNHPKGINTVMIDVHWLVYLGTLALSVLMAVAVMIVALLALGLVAVSLPVFRVFRKAWTASPSSGKPIGRDGTLRHERAVGSLNDRAGHLPVHRPEAAPWPTGEALHTGQGLETPTELDGRYPGSLRPGRVPPNTPRPRKTPSHCPAETPSSGHVKAADSEGLIRSSTVRFSRTGAEPSRPARL